MIDPPSTPLGATYLGDGRCQFLVWAPRTKKVDLHIVHPRSSLVAMTPAARGYFHAIIEDLTPGARYLYRLDEKNERPDPASRFQPEGVHGPSQVIDPAFAWSDAQWQGLPLHVYILYELHVGTFTREGTFDAIIPHLDELAALGVTVIELLPIGQFPGSRNWGYDGAYCFATQNSYGGPDGLRRLVNACHQRGLGVALDVVYNHIGPEGNYLGEFGHYYTDRYHTPWGSALNFDDRDSDEVRRYFIENALDWITDFHIDSLRLDAVHAIFDESARPFLRELGQAIQERAKQLGRHVAVIAESNKNDTRHSDSEAHGGYDLDGQWNDDFHHSLHALLTGETITYYADFGCLDQMAKAVAEGFVFTGDYSPYRGRRHGVSSRELAGERFVVFSQNHDQVGNRALGDRLTTIVDREALKLAAALVLLSPYVPMLFMGEEYGETAPFLYFVSYEDEALVEAVRRGRQREFDEHNWVEEMFDPQAESTFRACLLNRELRDDAWHAALYQFYRELMRLRKATPALAALDKQSMRVVPNEATKTLMVHRWAGDNHLVALYQFGEAAIWQGELPSVASSQSNAASRWKVILDSADKQWHGAGSEWPKQLAPAGAVSIPLKARQVVVMELAGGE